jgi:hypothetical protein
MLIVNINTYSQNKDLINKQKLTFEVNPVIDINNCIYWHVDFSELKSTVVFKNYVISLGLYGGLVALDTNLTAIDFKYSKKLNSDLFTNIAIRHDTLFSEKFNEIYFLNENDTTWNKYQLNDPVILFDILYEDEKYVFFPISQGEWGSMLFIYDKTIKKLRAVRTGDEAKCVYHQDNVYYINASLPHGGGSSTYFKIKNVEEINIVTKNISTLPHFRTLPVVEYPKMDNDPSREEDVLISILTIKYGTMVNCSFMNNKNTFHFVNFNGGSLNFGNQTLSYDKTYITKIVNKKMEIIDSLEEFHAYRTKSFNNFTIIGSYFFNKGYYISHNDSLYFVNFKGSPDYQIEYQSKNVTIKGVLINDSICREEYVYSPEFTRKFSCFLRSDIQINSFGDNTHFELTLTDTKKKKNIMLNSRWNVLNEAFKYNGNNLLYFFNLGNEDHKYGLIEIYNLERFINEYCE